MRFLSRKSIFGVVAGAVAVLIPAGLAWSCVALVAFRVNGTGTVAPGGTVEVFVGEFASDIPVEIRLDSPDGPVLLTTPPPTSTMTGQFTGQVPIPADVSPGPHVLVATQQHYDMNVGNTARAMIYVNSSAPAEPTPQERATSLVVEDESSAASYILIGLGVAAAGLLLAAVASMIVSRRPSSGQPEGVKTS